MSRRLRTSDIKGSMIAAALTIALAVTAAAPDASALAEKVQAYYERTKDFEAAFVQTYTYTAAGRSQTSRGTLRVKKPRNVGLKDDVFVVELPKDVHLVKMPGQ